MFYKCGKKKEINEWQIDRFLYRLIYNNIRLENITESLYIEIDQKLMNNKKIEDIFISIKIII